MKKLKESTVWIIIWILIYLAGFFTNIYDAFSNHGIHIINGQYYRFFTGLLLHTGLIHILGNILGIYFTGKFLDHQNFTVETSANHSLFRNFCKCNIFCNRTKQYQRRRFSDRIFFNRTGLCISVPMQRYTQISFPHTIRRMDRRICNFK